MMTLSKGPLFSLGSDRPTLRPPLVSDYPECSSYKWITVCFSISRPSGPYYSFRKMTTGDKSILLCVCFYAYKRASYANKIVEPTFFIGSCLGHSWKKVEKLWDHW